MAIKKILMIGNPNLRKCSDQVREFNSQISEIIQDLIGTLTFLQRKNKYGGGLAAPQIGYLKQVVYIDTPDKQMALINPKITWKSKERFGLWDSCFSFNVAFFVHINRNTSIEVEYQDEKGTLKKEIFTGYHSELLQHEIDHLKGILAVDHLQDPKQIIMRSEWEKLLTS